LKLGGNRFPCELHALAVTRSLSGKLANQTWLRSRLIARILPGELNPRNSHDDIDSAAKNCRKTGEITQILTGRLVRRFDRGSLILGPLAALSNHRFQKVFRADGGPKFSPLDFPKGNSNQVVEGPGKKYFGPIPGSQASLSLRCGKLVTSDTSDGKAGVFCRFFAVSILPSQGTGGVETLTLVNFTTSREPLPQVNLLAALDSPTGELPRPRVL